MFISYNGLAYSFFDVKELKCSRVDFHTNLLFRFQRH